MKKKTMSKVITYGTYDLIHEGHIRLLKRAKALGDYLIVAVTADDFDKNRGKINVRQSLMERIEGVRATGLADEIIVEEYEGQKIDDIRRLDVDIFTVGSDWKGQFDYLKAYCEVIYLERTQGISSSSLRAQKKVKLGLVIDSQAAIKYVEESKKVNGIQILGIFSNTNVLELGNDLVPIYNSFEDLCDDSDALCISSKVDLRYEYIKTAILKGKHILCESPIGLSAQECNELWALAKDNNVILMEAIKTAYATAYNRLILLAKSGKIGNIISVDATCTSMAEWGYLKDKAAIEKTDGSIVTWGPLALLPVLQLLGTNYIQKHIVVSPLCGEKNLDKFTKIDFIYKKSVGSIKVAKGAKSEGELIISGTQGYIYVPAPWWKTDYFELRYEDYTKNKRYYYQLDGEGIQYELVHFEKMIRTKNEFSYVPKEISVEIANILGSCVRREGILYLEEC